MADAHLVHGDGEIDVGAAQRVPDAVPHDAVGDLAPLEVAYEEAHPVGDTALVEPVGDDRRRRLGEHPWRVAQAVQDDLLHPVGRLVTWHDDEDRASADGRRLGEVAQRRARERPVGHHHLDAIGGDDSCRAPVDLDDPPDELRVLVELNPVADLERVLRLQGQPGEQVPERVLHGEADDGGEKRRGGQEGVDLRARQAVDRNLSNVSGTTREGVVEVVLSYNLYRGGADNARLRQAAEQLNQARDLREKACRDLRQTLAIAHNDVRRLQEQLVYLDQHQLSTENARQAYRDQFDIGQRTLLDLLDTENEYFQARRAYVSAVHDRYIAQARTLAGMGQLMSTLQVAREDLPDAAALGHADGVEMAALCAAEAPTMTEIDKEALFAEVMRESRR